MKSAHWAHRSLWAFRNCWVNESASKRAHSIRWREVRGVRPARSVWSAPACWRFSLYVAHAKVSKKGDAPAHIYTCENDFSTAKNVLFSCEKRKKIAN